MNTKRKNIFNSIIPATIGLLISLSIALYISLKNSDTNDIKSLAFAILGSLTGAIIAYLIAYLKRKDRKNVVMIMHTNSDKELANEIQKALNSKGIIAIDEDDIVLPGDYIKSRLNDYIEHKIDTLVVIQSESNEKVNQLSKALDIASEYNKQVIPIIKHRSIENSNKKLLKYKPIDIDSSFNDIIKALLKSIVHFSAHVKH